MLAAAGFGALGLGQAVPPTRRIPAASPNAAANVRFSDVTAAAGLSGFRHVSGGAEKNYIIETTGSGVALWDFDGDGLLDIYLVNGSTLEPRAAGPPRAALFRNNGDRTFRDVTAAAGVANERWGQGVCAGDVDNDGDPDLYVTNFGPNRLFRNLGDGRFDDVAVRAGVAVESWSTGCAFGDYDGDGWLDLYVAGYVAFDVQKPPPSPPRRQVSTADAPAPQGGRRDGRGVLGRRGVLHLPRASSDVRSARAPRRARSPLPQQRRRHLHRHDTSGRRHRRRRASTGSASPGSIWTTTGGWTCWSPTTRDPITCTATPARAGSRTSATRPARRSTAAAASRPTWAWRSATTTTTDATTSTSRTSPTTSTCSIAITTARSVTDVSFKSGVAQVSIPFLGWGTDFLDYDNDGWLDLLVVNGHVYPAADTMPWNTSYAQRALLFRNLEGRRFEEIGAAAGDGLSDARVSRGSAVGDLDNDGGVDVVINNIDGAPTVARNVGGAAAGHWLTIRLVGDPGRKCPRDAIGSVVFVTAGGLRRRGEVASGRGQISQSDLRVHIGLGRETKVSKLEVRWAGGDAVSYAVDRVDTLVTIDQAERAGHVRAIGLRQHS